MLYRDVLVESAIEDIAMEIQQIVLSTFLIELIDIGSRHHCFDKVLSTSQCHVK